MHRALLMGLYVTLTAAGYAQQQQAAQQTRDRGTTDSNRDRAARGGDSRHDRQEIPAGTEIPIRLDESINVKERTKGTSRGSVAQDVVGTDGILLIPRGAEAELRAVDLGNNDLTVDLESVTIDGRRYTVNAAEYDRAHNTGVEINKRTGEFVGGGALFGTIVGAPAGGAAGGGAQVLTRGRVLNVPAETILRFKLNQPLEVREGRQH